MGDGPETPAVVYWSQEAPGHLDPGAIAHIMNTHDQVTWNPVFTDCPLGVTARGWAMFGRHVRDGESVQSIARGQHCSTHEVNASLLSVNRAVKTVQLVRGTGLEGMPYRLIPALLRAGFASAEQVRHAGDGALMKVDGVGPSALAHIRALIPAASEIDPLI